MDEKSKVAIIAGQLVVGGAERQLYLWLAHMNRDRFDPLVITLHPNHDDFWENPIEDLGIPLFRVTQKPGKLERLVEMIRILRSFKPDIIHGWHFFSSAYAGLAARILGVPCIAGIRSQYDPEKKGLDTFLVKTNCDAVIANSNASAAAYRKALGKNHQTVFTVPNAVLDTPTDRGDLRKELSKTYNLPADAIWIYSVGRMDPLKRFDILLEMAYRLEDSPVNYYFIIVGDGPEQAQLITLAKATNIVQKVSFLGEIPNANYWMSAMDIFCFPSMSEGLPNAVMEAAAAGLPIVAWNLPFCQELLPDDSQALLLEPENLDAMAEALTQLLNSPQLRAHYGSSARAHILDNFGLHQYVHNMTHVYESVLMRYQKKK